MAITLMLRDVPLGVTPQEAAALVLGPERVANDVLITIRTIDDCEAWDRSMRERFAGQPLPAFVRTCMDDIAPPVSPPASTTLSAPADYASVAESLRPLKAELADKQ